MRKSNPSRPKESTRLRQTRLQDGVHRAEAESVMAVALRLAGMAAEQDEVPVGAVVVHRGRIIGSGYNRREQDQDPLAHAEILALREAARTLGSWRLKECALYVTLEPCPMCLAACQQARVDRVIYGAVDLKGGALSLGYRLHEDARANHRFEVEKIDCGDCGAILTEFFRRKRKET